MADDPLRSSILKGTWDDPAITSDTRIDEDDPWVRAVAESLHSNESMHLHWYVGAVVCPYCALRATRAVRICRQAGGVLASPAHSAASAGEQ